MRIPRYRKHSTRDFGFVEWEGKRHRLPGRFDSPESRKAYEKFIAGLHRTELKPQSMTVEVLVGAYLDFAEKHYIGKWGHTAYHNMRPIFRRLLEMHRHEMAVDFGPKKLKAFRQRLIDDKLSLQTINQGVAYVRRMFRYGVSEELLPSSAWEALRSVPKLAAGRSEAKELPPRLPVSWQTVEATLPFMPPIIAAMVQSQWWIGCRSESICLARTAEFDRRGEVWLWTPRHKTEATHKLVLAVGPKAQEHLRPYLAKEPFMFQPVATRRRLKHFTPKSYGGAVRRAIERANREKKQGEAKVAHWSPHQLRRARATAIREQHGVEAAQAVIGHESVDTTELYAAKSLALAIRIALASG